jgi:hypothetical protein
MRLGDLMMRSSSEGVGRINNTYTPITKRSTKAATFSVIYLNSLYQIKSSHITNRPNAEQEIDSI